MRNSTHSRTSSLSCEWVMSPTCVTLTSPMSMSHGTRSSTSSESCVSPPPLNPPHLHPPFRQTKKNPCKKSCVPWLCQYKSACFVTCLIDTVGFVTFLHQIYTLVKTCVSQISIHLWVLWHVTTDIGGGSWLLHTRYIPLWQYAYHVLILTLCEIHTLWERLWGGYD